MWHVLVLIDQMSVSFEKSKNIYLQFRIVFYQLPLVMIQNIFSISKVMIVQVKLYLY